MSERTEPEDGGQFFWGSPHVAMEGVPPHTAEARLLPGDGSARILSDGEVAGWDPSMGCLWIHLDYTHPAHQKWLRQYHPIDAVTADAMLAEDTRPRAFQTNDAIVINLRGVNLLAEGRPDELVSIRMWIQKDRIISTRKRDMLATRELVQSFESRTGPTTSVDFLLHLMEWQIYGMRETTEILEEQIYNLEEQVVSTYDDRFKLQLSNLRRHIIGLRRFLAPQREALVRLQSERFSLIDSANQLRVREISDQLTLIIEDLDAASERATITQEQFLGQLSEQLNKRMYIISLMTVIFLPLTFVTGMLGMNISGIPGQDNPSAFISLSLLMAFIVGAQVLLFRWKKWM
jgi:zinc transporter